jgi:putative acetyltransferase
LKGSRVLSEAAATGVPMITIREEETRDGAAVRDVNERAFGGPEEARIVAAVRGTPASLSLVAEEDGRVVGHILFTPVRIEGAVAGIRATGLGPMAVVPDLQRREIGSRLVLAGLEACRALGYDAVVVVGHPSYYPRFGFSRADALGLRFEAEVPPEAFMALELRPGALSGRGGIVRYLPEFSGA